MTDAEAPQTDATQNGERTLGRLAAAMEGAKGASERHVALAVPIRAVERNRRVAASVLAGGLAYRLFLWLLPFGLIRRRRSRASATRTTTEDAVEGGGVPAAISNAIGDASRAADSNSMVALRGRNTPSLLGGLHGCQGGSCSFIRSSGTSLPARAKPVGGSLCSRACCVRRSSPLSALSSWVR